MNHNPNKFFIRSSERFYNEMKNIQKKREEMGLKKISTRILTNLIIKHNDWDLMREDIINYKFNKNDE